MLSVSQLLTPMTADQFRSQAVTILQSLGMQPQNWAQGSVASTVLSTACNLLATLSSRLSNAIAQQWNPTATGDGLVLLSYYFYNNNPSPGTAASGNVVFTNSGGGLYTFAAGQVTVQSTVANSLGQYPRYTNTVGFTLNPLSTLTVPVQCTVVGSLGNSAPGFVTQLITTMDGVTVNNPNPILGTDPLSDAQLRQLNIDSLSAGSVFGPRSIYEFAITTAKNAVTGLPVAINRQKISTASHTNLVTIYVCGPDGTTDSNDLLGAALNIEELARPDGVDVGPGSVVDPSTGLTIGAPAAATPVTYAPSITAYVSAPKGTQASTIQAAILNGISTWFESDENPIGGLTASDDNNTGMTGIFESGVSGVIAQAVATVTGCIMTATKFTGTSDLALLSDQVAVSGISSVTVIVTYQGS